MLIELEIENLALIRHARVPFGAGLNVLTGETGTGKTLLIRALEVVRGGRFDRRQIREGTDSCQISALFQLEGLHRDRVVAILDPDRDPDRDSTRVPWGLEDGQLLVTRKLSRNAPGRVYLNGKLAPLSTLRSLSRELLDVVGQGETRLLADGEYRTSLLDLIGGLAAARDTYLPARKKTLELRRRMDRLLSEAQERRRRLEFLRFERGEIDAADPQPGEIHRLESELSVLEDLDRLRTLIGESLHRLYESDESLTDRLGRMLREIGQLSTGARELLDPASNALKRATDEIGEAVSLLRGTQDGLEADPARTQVVSERLNVLRTLLDRFGPTEQQLFDDRSRIETELTELETDQEDLATLGQELEEATSRLEKQGTDLDQARKAAGSKLALQVELHLGSLGMQAARFQVALLPHPGQTVLERSHASGMSTVQFLLAANPGHSPQPLSRVASGGEAARVALAIRKALASVLDLPTLLFDEIDAGIGARLGEAVGQCLASIAAHRQVLSVTHLPQVAACAENHILVQKSTRSGRAEAHLSTLTGAAREAEIAAMMRGARASAKTHSEARQLLDEAGGQA